MRWGIAVACLVAGAAHAGPLPVDAPGAVQDPAIAEADARAYVTAHPELGVRAQDLVVVANRIDAGTRSVGFRQTWQGAPVVDGQIGFVFSHDRLFAIFPHLITSIRATGALQGHAVLRTRSGDRVVDVHENAGETVYVDPASGTPIDRRSKVSHGASTLVYDVGARYATGPRVDVPAPDAEITVDGLARTTADDGTFLWAGTNSALVQPGLTGSYVTVINEAGSLASTTLTVQPGETARWSQASDEKNDAQLSAFVYVSLAKAHARIVNPAVASWIDSPLTVHVNEPGTCDAYATPNELYFYRADAQCQNSARVADVVFHEFTHALHHHSVIAGVGMFEQQLSEGLADWFAADMNEDPGIGRGFRYDSVPERDIDPYGIERRWPEDIGFDTHVTGEIISGALWDLRTALVRELGQAAGVAQAEKIFTGILQRALDIPSSYQAALVADDDDGNLSNGTPHFCAIQQAFGAHGLAEPDFATTSIASPIAGGQNIRVDVTTPTGRACPPPQVTSITVTWHVGNGVPSELQLAPDGASWKGMFPEQPSGTVIAYSVDAALDDGTHIVMPNNPADPEYQLFEGSVVPIVCELMDHDPQWPQVGTEWEWAQAGLEPTSKDPPAAHTGTHVLGTDLTHDGNYAPNELTTISIPTVDISAWEIVHLQYWRWLTVEDGKYDRADLLVDRQSAWSNASDHRAGVLDHVDKEWRFQDIDLTPYGSGSVSITWSLASDGSNQLGGWTLDDVCVVGVPKLATCGDGFVDRGEQCDDGNTVDGDGCSASCQLELTAGGGGCDAGGGSPGALVLVLYFACRRCSRRWPSRSVSLRMP